MRIGYPCLASCLPWKSAKTFRLASYSEDRLCFVVEYNLTSLMSVLEFNRQEDLMFFRISSDLIPFASHPVNQFRWQDEFSAHFDHIGSYIIETGMRISAHPDQFTLINSPGEEIFQRSAAELVYHAEMMDLMNLDASHKIQIHVGGVYGDKPASIARFIERYPLLPAAVRRRLVIENDDRLYSLADCLRIHQATGVPILFDTFHHSILNEGEPLVEALDRAARTWSVTDGSLMIDYSSQQPEKRVGTHATSINIADFRQFLGVAQGRELDVMLEIKDKEVSALQARAAMGPKTKNGLPIPVGKPSP